MRVPCFRALEKLAGCPEYLAGPVIRSHISFIFVLYLAPTSSVVTSLVDVPQKIQEFLDSDVRDILFALYGGLTLLPGVLLKMSLFFVTDGSYFSQYSW